MRADADLILRHQAPTGAYPASPTFSQYPHCWLRDGAFTAYAMDLAGHRTSAGAFHTWAAAAVLGHAHAFEALKGAAREGRLPDDDAFPPTRYALDGRPLDDGWPNFQLDGYGHWLWSLERHRRGGGRLGDDERRAAHLVASYLASYWWHPCYDAWEEFRSQLHTSTLASVYGGLRAAEAMLGDGPWSHAAAEVRAVITDECVSEGRFVKHVGNGAVDASLLWVSTPFAVVPEDHPVMLATVDEIESTLVVDGGVHRYRADTFFGGGAWVLLTAWLGWYHARAGRVDRARACAAWVGRQRRAGGCLPEQVPTSASNERFLRYWRERWGDSASPLLWSHAMAIVLRHAIDEALTP